MNGKSVDVDSRPSDAIALAVRAQAPIYVADDVLDKAGIKLDESGKPIAPEDENNKPQQVREEDLRRISAFTDFINTLDMEGIGKEGQQGTGLRPKRLNLINYPGIAKAPTIWLELFLCRLSAEPILGSNDSGRSKRKLDTST